MSCARACWLAGCTISLCLLQQDWLGQVLLLHQAYVQMQHACRVVKALLDNTVYIVM